MTTDRPTTHARHASWRSLLHATILMALCLGIPCGARAEGGAPVSFAVSPQALDRALVEFSRTSGVEILADGRLTAGKSSPGVTGRHSPEEALRQILAGTGLKAQSTPSGTMTIEPAPKASPNPEPLAQAAPPPEPEPETVILPEITVTATPWDDTSYNALDASTATKTDTPIMETPVSVQVVPQQVLRDQAAFRLQDAVENVSGVQFFNSSGNEFDSFLIRGFGDSKPPLKGFATAFGPQLPVNRTWSTSSRWRSSKAQQRSCTAASSPVGSSIS